MGECKPGSERCGLQGRSAAHRGHQHLPGKGRPSKVLLQGAGPTLPRGVLLLCPGQGGLWEASVQAQHPASPSLDARQSRGSRALTPLSPALSLPEVPAVLAKSFQRPRESKFRTGPWFLAPLGACAQPGTDGPVFTQDARVPGARPTLCPLSSPP